MEEEDRELAVEYAEILQRVAMYKSHVEQSLLEAQQSVLIMGALYGLLDADTYHDRMTRLVNETASVTADINAALRRLRGH